MKEYYGWQSYNNGICKWSNYENILINIRVNNVLIITFTMKMRVFINCSLIVAGLRIYIIFLIIFEDKMYFKNKHGLLNLTNIFKTVKSKFIE